MSDDYVTVLLDGKSLSSRYSDDIFHNEGNTAIDHAIKEAVEDTADFAKRAFQEEVPKASGKLAAAAFSTRATKAPLGYEAEAGIDRIKGVRRASQIYPLFVSEGTGLFGPKHSLITSTIPGKAMTFSKLGEPRVFARFTTGQFPNAFFARVQRRTNDYLERKKQELRVILKYLL